jgi:hypothetical protein
MNPRYQIFISSTFRDLQPERQAVLEAVLEMGHFPAGMEVFPAANATPWTLIEAIIKESDYYVVIIGGMYGSTDENGVSYTEREYDFALASGLPILGFLHKAPGAIPANFSEMRPGPRKRLEAFREKVEQHHHCKYWVSADELKAQVVIGITHATRVTPRVGWVRADKSENPETLKKLTSAMEENAQLQNQIKQLRDVIGGRSPGGEGLASGSDPVTLRFDRSDKTKGQLDTTWDEVFFALAPSLMSEADQWACLAQLGQFVRAHLILNKQATPDELKAVRIELNEQDFNRVLYQFIALDYVEPVTLVSQTYLFDRPETRREQGYTLTKRGAHYFATRQATRKPA